MKALYTLLILTSLGFAQDEFAISNSTVGGYGELHINSVNEDGKPTKTTADFHRFVLFYGYNFADKWSFKAEVELEHNFVKDGDGELELEQAYVDYHHSDAFGFRAGVVLAPVGYINEVHEPPTFLGVERPTFDKYIIPTTWFDNGFSFYGTLSEKVNYNVSIMGGLDGNGILAEGIRSGRTKGYKGNINGYNFNNPTFIVRADFIGVDGLNAGFSYTSSNALTYAVDVDGDFLKLTGGLETSILDLHAKYEKDNLFGKVQYGKVSLDKDRAGYDGHVGFLVEAGYDVFSGDDPLIPFVRYEDLNLRSGHATQATEDASHSTILTFGASYKPVEQVVFKLDYQTTETKEDGAKAVSTLSFGVGYMF